MNNQQFHAPHSARSRLRATIAEIEREILRAPGETTRKAGCAPSALRASFADLVEQLALGPEPELRECPSCKQLGMRVATRCGYCWEPLTPSRRGAAVG